MRVYIKTILTILSALQARSFLIFCCGVLVTTLALPALAATADKPLGKSSPKAISSLDYAIKIVPVSAGIEWLITLKMTGNANGVTEFELPNQWAGRDDLLKGIKDFSVTGGELNDSAKADEAVEIRRVTHAPGALLTIQYRLVRIGNAYPESHREAFRRSWNPLIFM